MINRFFRLVKLALMGYGALVLYAALSGDAAEKMQQAKREAFMEGVSAGGRLVSKKYAEIATSNEMVACIIEKFEQSTKE